MITATMTQADGVSLVSLDGGRVRVRLHDEADKRGPGTVYGPADYVIEFRDTDGTWHPNGLVKSVVFSIDADSNSAKWVIEFYEGPNV